MKQRVWEYELSPDVSTFEMPEGAKVLTVQAHGGVPMLWSLVDPDRPRNAREFLTVGTGDPIDTDPLLLTYVATFQLGPLAFHVFEKK